MMPMRWNVRFTSDRAVSLPPSRGQPIPQVWRPGCRPHMHLGWGPPQGGGRSEATRVRGGAAQVRLPSPGAARLRPGGRRCRPRARGRARHGRWLRGEPAPERHRSSPPGRCRVGPEEGRVRAVGRRRRASVGPSRATVRRPGSRTRRRPGCGAHAYSAAARAAARHGFSPASGRHPTPASGRGSSPAHTRPSRCDHANVPGHGDVFGETDGDRRGCGRISAAFRRARECGGDRAGDWVGDCVGDRRAGAPWSV